MSACACGGMGEPECVCIVCIGRLCHRLDRLRTDYITVTATNFTYAQTTHQNFTTRFYTYQFNAVNGALFTTRTRGLNSALYWAMQMIAAYLFGDIFLDLQSLSRRKRAIYGFFILAMMFTLAWGVGLYLQIGRECPSDCLAHDKIDCLWLLVLMLSTAFCCIGAGFEGGYDKGSPLPEGPIDMHDTSRFFFPWFVFMFYGFNDALLQTYALYQHLRRPSSAHIGCLFSCSLTATSTRTQLLLLGDGGCDERHESLGKVRRLLQGCPERGRGCCLGCVFIQCYDLRPYFYNIISTMYVRRAT